MVVRAILVALIATCSTWWFSHVITRTWLYPIWSGFLVGIVMGRPMEGMMLAAAINLPYVGFITAGGSMPGNAMFAGSVGTALGLVSGLDMTTATTIGVILGSVAVMIWNAYMSINSVWVHMADKYAAKGNLKMIRFCNYVPSFFVSLILNGIPAFLIVMKGAVVGDWLAACPHVGYRWLRNGRRHSPGSRRRYVAELPGPEEDSSVLLPGLLPCAVPRPEHDGYYHLRRYHCLYHLSLR